MTDAEILSMKLNLTQCSLNDKQNEEFLTKLDDFHDVFSLRDEIGTCPLIKVHLKFERTKLHSLQDLTLCEKNKRK